MSKALEESSRRRQLAEYFRGEARRELEYAERLRATSDKSLNPVVRAIMEAVSQDSVKHSKIYETMALLLENPGLITETESSSVLKDMEEHIKMEKESIDELVRLKDDDLVKGDPALQFLIDMLLRDEQFHHAALSQIYNALIKSITLTEQDIWDAIWRDAMYHGTPGG
mgnify:CR=1 FL=1